MTCMGFGRRAGGSRRAAAIRGPPRRSPASAAAQPRRARLLACAGVPVQRAALDGLVDQLHQLAVLVVGPLGLAAGDGGLQAAEVRLDRRRVAPVLAALARRAQDALLLGMD